MNYKLLVLDVDGTLLNAGNYISDEDKSAIAEARSRGVVVALCTGRVNQATQTVLNSLDLDGFHIFSDGAVVTSADNKKTIYAKTIDETLAKQLAVYIHEKHITTIDFFTPTDEYIETKTQPWFADIRRNFFGLEPQVIDFDKLCECERIIKATHAVASVQDRKLAKECQSKFGDKLKFSVSNNVSYPEIDFFNIIDPGVSKGEAVKFLINYLGLCEEECIGIGDGINDVPLLSCVGLGIAMGHAPDSLKKVAKCVTLDVAHSGVAAAVRKFILDGK
jgi:Cof subfamily protein (haloacid dehalogenase superfamily)